MTRLLQNYISITGPLVSTLYYTSYTTPPPSSTTKKFYTKNTLHQNQTTSFILHTTSIKTPTLYILHTNTQHIAKIYQASIIQTTPPPLDPNAPAHHPQKIFDSFIVILILNHHFYWSTICTMICGEISVLST